MQTATGRMPRRTRSAPACPRCALDSSAPIEILSISSTADDHDALRQVVEGMPCRFESTGTCRTALRRLNAGRISIVVCERDLPDGTWRDILDCVGSSSDRPYLIVTSKSADERLWAEVLNLGGYDVIAKPFNQREARHILETACLGRRMRIACGHGPSSR